ncbi:MAG: alpha/beta fold hydrolase [Candidatus Lokiarchaeota archaeon]|nr:alpha/beta fold hydrolase [Candidatus Lokiarchaeota archaeon]
MINSILKSNTPINNIPQDYCPSNDFSWFKVKSGLDKGKMMFYRDSFIHSNNSKKTILFVHGNPESSYTYRKIIQLLIKVSEEPFRIIAMDHIGFGLSDQATYEMVCMDHAQNLIQLIRELDLYNITLIIHDWGGPIGIGALLKDPQRVSNLIILNSTIFPIPQEGITFQNYPISWLGWCYTPYIISNKFWGDFAAYAIFSNPTKPIPLLLNMLKNIVLMEFGSFQKPHEEAQKFFREQFGSYMNILSSKRLVMQTKYWGWGNVYKDNVLGKRSTINFYKDMREKITPLWGPKGQNVNIRAILGRWDPLAQNCVIKQWINALPQLKRNLKIFQNVGHFIEEVKYHEIAQEILRVANLT